MHRTENRAELKLVCVDSDLFFSLVSYFLTYIYLKHGFPTIYLFIFFFFYRKLLSLFVSLVNSMKCYNSNLGHTSEIIIQKKIK